MQYQYIEILRYKFLRSNGLVRIAEYKSRLSYVKSEHFCARFLTYRKRDRYVDRCFLHGQLLDLKSFYFPKNKRKNTIC